MDKSSLTILMLFVLSGRGGAFAQTYSVDNINDSGAGSLRQAIVDLNSGGNVAGNCIVFTTGGVITLLSDLPEITRPVLLSAANGNVLLQRTSASYHSNLMASAASISLPSSMSFSMSGSSFESGLYSSGDMMLEGPLNSDIEVTSISAAQGSVSHGIRAEGAVAINGDLGGRLVVSAQADNAIGVRARNDIAIHGGIDAQVMTYAATDNSYGLFVSNGGITVTGGLADSSSIRATAGGSYAGAMLAVQGGIHIDGDLGGVHSAIARDYARTFYAYNSPDSTTNAGLDIHGSVSGTVEATSTLSQAFGIVSRYAEVMITGDISPESTIRATVTNGGGAYGVYTYYGDLDIGGNVLGSVAAEAATSDAEAISGYNNLHVGGNVDGRVSAKAGTYGAEALWGYDSLAIGGGVSGSVTAEAGTVASYAILSNGALSIAGPVSGTVTATAGTYGAAGICSDGVSGSIHGIDADHPLEITGRVGATAQGGAAGVASFGPMNLLVSGSGVVSGRVLSGSGQGYAIYSGGVGLSGGYVSSIPSLDRVVIAEDAVLAGSVDLGRGNDFLKIRDHSSILNAQEINGGTGEERGKGDSLVFANWSGNWMDSFMNWEYILVSEGSSINLGQSRTISASSGLSVDMVIDAGSAVYGTGLSAGRYVINGSIRNNGLLELRDGIANDRVTATSGVSGIGRLGLDVAMGADQNRTDDRERLDLIVVGPYGSTGGSLAGQMSLGVRNISPGGAILQTMGNGILVAQVNGVSTSDALVLDQTNAFREAGVRLLKGGALGTGEENWYLVVLREAPPEDHYLMEAVAPAAADLGLQAIPRFHERQAYGWSAKGQQREPASGWTRVTGSRFDSETESAGSVASASGYRSTLQAGMDLCTTSCGSTLYRTGIYAGTGYLHASATAPWGIGAAGNAYVIGLGIGGYASVEQRRCWYLEWVAQADRYTVDAAFRDGGRGNGAAWGHALSMEGGRYLAVGRGISLEPQAQLILQHTDGYGMSAGTSGKAWVGPIEGLVGRVGMTGIWEPERGKIKPYVDLNLVKDFRTTPSISYEGLERTWQVNRDRLFFGSALGITSMNLYPDDLEFYVKAGVMVGLDGHHSREYIMTAGLRKSW